MAVVEALTNLICADVRDLSQVRLSANWMADAAHDGCALFEGVESIGMELCPELGDIMHIFLLMYIILYRIMYTCR